MKDREAWYIAVHGVTKSLAQLSNWTTTEMWLPKMRNWNKIKKLNKQKVKLGSYFVKPNNLKISISLIDLHIQCDVNFLKLSLLLLCRNVLADF